MKTATDCAAAAAAKTVAEARECLAILSAAARRRAGENVARETRAAAAAAKTVAEARECLAILAASSRRRAAE